MEKKKNKTKTKKRKEGGQPNNKNAEKWTEEEALNLAAKLIEWLRPKIKDGKDVHANNFFCNTFLVLQNGYNKSTIEYLSRKFKSFSEQIKTAKDIQEIKIAEAALLGNVDKSVAIFTLKTNHEWVAPVVIEGNSKKPLEVKTTMRDFLGNLNTADKFEK